MDPDEVREKLEEQLLAMVRDISLEDLRNLVDYLDRCLPAILRVVSE